MDLLNVCGKLEAKYPIIVGVRNIYRAVEYRDSLRIVKTFDFKIDADRRPR